MSTLDDLMEADSDNVKQWRDNFRKYDLTLPEVFDMAAEMFVTFARCIEGTQDESADQRILNLYGEGHGLTDEETIRRVGGPDSVNLVPSDTRLAYVRMRARRARAVIFLLLQRSYMWGASDLFRARTTSAAGHSRLEAEARTRHPRLKRQH